MSAQSSGQLRLFDQQLSELPEDLYVPPEAFEIWLDQFEGPLDFLLYLVQKNGLDLTQMALLPITEQYLSYIDQLQAKRFELAGDYLLMAATLIDIKSRLMLPEDTKPEKLEADPTKLLLERLAAYAQIKQVSQQVDKLNRLERDVFEALASAPKLTELPQLYDVQLLHDAWVSALLRPRLAAHEVIEDTVPLHERMAQITAKISQLKICTFVDLLSPAQGRLGAVVSFVAVLELLKQQLIEVISLSEEPLALSWLGERV